MISSAFSGTKRNSRTCKENFNNVRNRIKVYFDLGFFSLTAFTFLILELFAYQNKNMTFK